MKTLEGVTILDFSQGHAGSVATMGLADFGATVIKVERQDSPDPTRSWTPMQNGHSVYFTYLNRGKESITLDYTSQAGKEVMLDLVKQADVVCTSLSQADMTSYGLDYPGLCQVNPAIIYASLTPFGNSGPLKDKKAHDLNLQAIGGMMDRTGFADGPATPVGCRVADHISAIYLMLGINLALIHKLKTGEGQELDLSQHDCLFAMMETGPWVWSISGKQLPRTGNSYPSISPYDTLKAKNGYLSVGVSTDGQWQKFCKALDIPEIGADQRFMTNEARGDSYEGTLKPQLEAVTTQRDKFEMESTLRNAKLACAAVYTVPEIMASEHIAVRDMLPTVEDKGAGTVQIPGTTIKLMGTPATIEAGAPLLGEHTQAYLEQLGYDPETLKKLVTAN